MRERVKIEKVDKAPEAPSEGDEKFDTTIYINEKWRVVWDGLQYIAQTKHTRTTGAKAGQYYWRNVAYIRHFGEVLLWLARRQIYSVPGTYSGVETLKALNDSLDRIETEIRTVMKDFMAKRYDATTGKIS